MQLKLGDSIRTHRKEMGLTQEHLAEALGVTVGAVHKWESGKTTPELTMLVQIAQFFETSIDELLGYGWENGTMGQAAKQIAAYRNGRNFEEGFRFAEHALQKYPNSFAVVYQSALLYFMSMIHFRGKSAHRAIELFERSIPLIDQHTDETITIVTIQNQMAGCYCYLNDMDKAIDLLKHNNIGGLNNAKIGLLMSQNPKRAEESLEYLSTALHNDYAQIYEICIGYANAYGVLEQLDKIEDLMHWLLDFGKGLKRPDALNIIDKANVRIYTILAEVRLLQGDTAGAEKWLRQAKATALKFDADPQYQSAYGMKFFHGNTQSTSYDDMGETAISMIDNYMEDDTAGKNLRPLWAKIRKE